MEKRKLNKEATKRVILKTIGAVILIDIAVILICGIIFFIAGVPIGIMELICGIVLVMDILPIMTFGSVFIEEERNKVKAEIAENIFRKDDSTIVYPKVFPKKGHFKQKKFFEEELPKIADYFANLYEDGEIEVVARLKNNEAILHVENISKENFTEAYEVLSTTLTDSLN